MRKKLISFWRVVLGASDVLVMPYCTNLSLLVAISYLCWAIIEFLYFFIYMGCFREYIWITCVVYFCDNRRERLVTLSVILITHLNSSFPFLVGRKPIPLVLSIGVRSLYRMLPEFNFVRSSFFLVTSLILMKSLHVYQVDIEALYSLLWWHIHIQNHMLKKYICF